jgi:PAS domain S-box-containing protein
MTKEVSKLKNSIIPFSKNAEIESESDVLNLQSAALEAAANAIVITDSDGTIKWVNSSFTQLTGYSKEEAFGKNPRILKSDKHEDEFYRELWKTIKKGEIWTGIIINKKKCGALYHEEMTITPIKNETGKITNFIAIKQNVTDSQYKLKQLIENSTLGLIRLAPNGKIIMANPAMVSILGYKSESEIIAQNNDKIYYSIENKKRFLELLKRRKKVYAFEDVFIKKDGTLINVKESAWTVRDENNDTMYYEVIVEDITELNQILKILHESEFKYRTLIDKLNEAVYLIIDRKFEIVNQKFLDLLEITEEELSLPGFNMFNFVSEESKNILKERSRNIKQGKNIPKKYDMILITKKGNEKEVEISETFLNFNGKIATQGVVRDLTKIRKAETQIRHLQKMEAIGTLAAGIAHEINTPSQFVNDNLNFLKEVNIEFEPIYKFLSDVKKTNRTIEELKQIIENIDLEYLQTEVPIAIEQSIDGVQRIAKIVAAMRDFSHAGPKEKVAANVHKLINSSLTISRNAWKYIAKIEKDFDDSIPPIVCLASDLGQVFVNIIINAAHALEEKFNNSETLQGKISIKTINKGNDIEIIFSDNGIGMSKKVQKRIFDPFFTTKDVGKGTGQGLAIAYDIIVDKHHGSINVESEENIGTKLSIILPQEDNITSEQEFVVKK